METETHRSLNSPPTPAAARRPRPPSVTIIVTPRRQAGCHSVGLSIETGSVISRRHLLFLRWARLCNDSDLYCAVD